MIKFQKNLKLTLVVHSCYKSVLSRTRTNIYTYFSNNSPPPPHFPPKHCSKLYYFLITDKIKTSSWWWTHQFCPYYIILNLKKVSLPADVINLVHLVYDHLQLNTNGAITCLKCNVKSPVYGMTHRFLWKAEELTSFLRPLAHFRCC